MLLNRAAITAAATGYKKLFHDGRASVQTIYAELAMEETSSGDREVYQLAPLGVNVREWTGDRRITGVRLFDYTIINADYEATVAVPRNAFEDDKLGHFNAQFVQLGMEADLHPDELLATLLSGGFAGTGYDGVAFFSNSHLTMDGANNRDNLVSGALASSTFQEAYQLLEGMKAFNGKPLNPLRKGKGLVLMVPPALRATAEAIVEAQFSTAGISNVNYGKAKIIVNPYLSTSTEWYLSVSGGAMKPFIHQIRRRHQLVVIDGQDSEDLFYRKQIVFGSDGRYAMGYGHFDLIVGSTGA